MGTRSRIGVMHGEIVKSIYVHWDGYLSHNGKILLDHYDSAKANHLVALGDVSSLREHIVIPDGVDHSFEKPLPGVTVFYGRDRGEKGTEFKSAFTFAEFLEQCDNCGAEYYYIMKDGVWYCGTTYTVTHPLSKQLTELAVAIENEKESA